MKYLFVYGTLRRGSQNRFANLLAGAGEFIGHGSVQGRLYQMADYPGIVASQTESDVVRGDVFGADNSADLWAVLDEYEGSEYERTIVTVTLDDGATLAADAYLYRGPAPGLRR